MLGNHKYILINCLLPNNAIGDFNTINLVDPYSDTKKCILYVVLLMLIEKLYNLIIFIMPGALITSMYNQPSKFLLKLIIKVFKIWFWQKYIILFGKQLALIQLLEHNTFHKLANIVLRCFFAFLTNTGIFFLHFNIADKKFQLNVF